MKKRHVLVIAFFVALCYRLNAWAQEPLWWYWGGDPSSYLFDLVDLTCDDTWNDYDFWLGVEGHPPALVSLNCVFRTGAAGDNFYWRRNGQSNAVNILRFTMTDANRYYGHVFHTIEVDSGGTAEYRCTSNLNTASCGIQGYWYTMTIPAAAPTPTPGCPPHAETHEAGGSDEISVDGLDGLLNDYQMAGYIEDAPIIITGPLTISDVLYYSGAAYWTDGQASSLITPGGDMSPVVTISGTVPVIITSTYQYTEALTSGNQIAVIRSFTYGDASIAIALFALLALLGARWIIDLTRQR